MDTKESIDMIQSADINDIKTFIEDMDSRDIATLVENMNADEMMKLIEKMDEIESTDFFKKAGHWFKRTFKKAKKKIKKAFSITKKLSDFTKYSKADMLEFAGAAYLAEIAYLRESMVKYLESCSLANFLTDFHWKWYEISPKKFSPERFDVLWNAWKFLHQNRSDASVGKKVVWKHIEKKDVELYVFCDGERLTISWRGTEADSFNDIKADLKFRKKSWPYNSEWKDGKVSRGFLDCYAEVRTELQKVVENFMDRYKPKAIDITGHSMGAALAGINCVDFTSGGVNLGGAEVRCVTVCMPAMCNKPFQRLANEHFRRHSIKVKNLINYGDIFRMGHNKPVVGGFSLGDDVWLKTVKNYKTVQMSAHKVTTYIQQLKWTEKWMNKTGQKWAPNQPGMQHFKFLDDRVLTCGFLKSNRYSDRVRPKPLPRSRGRSGRSQTRRKRTRQSRRRRSGRQWSRRRFLRFFRRRFKPRFFRRFKPRFFRRRFFRRRFFR